MLVSIALMLGVAQPGLAQTPPKPNVIYILADDLGYGSVGFNNPATPILTPNLNSLAAGGMKLSFNYCPDGLCAPTRASLLSGFHNGHTFIDRNGNIGAGFRAQDVTSGHVLQSAGYRTAMFGKWGFGSTQEDASFTTPPSISSTDSEPRHRGFTDFYGYMNHTGAHNYFSPWLWNGNAAATTPVATGNTAATPTAAYTHDLIGQQSLNYITANAGNAQPFFMYISYTIPHFDLDDIDNAPGGLGVYASNPSMTAAEKRVAAMITRMDASIGDLVNRLRDPNNDGSQADSILDDTLIVFSSDNGATQEDNTPYISLGMNAPFRGGKRDLYEGGVRSPTLAYWNGTIAPGSVSNRLTDTADILPTLAELAGVRGPVGMDGVSLAATLTGQGMQRARDYLYLEHNEGGGPDADARDPRWAVIRAFNGGLMKLISYSNGTLDLFNITTDIAETSPLNQSTPANAAIVATLQGIAAAEGAGQPDSYAVEYATWTGTNGGTLGVAGNWGGAIPAANWSAVLANTDASASVITAPASVEVLGLEIAGPSAARMQTLRVLQNATVTGRNEVRISPFGRVVLDRGTLASNRWVDVLPDGVLGGHGNVVGHVYNAGIVAPGRPSDLPPIGGGSVNTGVVDAIDFNFTGVQNNAPITATSTLNSNLALVAGLNFGPGLTLSTANNRGNEFNYAGHTTGDLASAIANNDYLTFTVQPVSGIEMLVDDVTFRIGRNGTNAAHAYAIMTSQAGFTAGNELGSLVIGNSTVVTTFTAPYTGGAWTAGPLEVRLYGYNSVQTSGNTHVDLATMDASFRSIPGAAVEPAGVLTITGGYTQMPGAALLLELGGTDADSAAPDFDYLVVNGPADLAGSIEVTLLAGYSPAAGDAFAVVLADDINGIGNNLAGVAFTLPTLPNGLTWESPQIVPAAGGREALQLSVVPEPATAALLAAASLLLLRRRV